MQEDRYEGLTSRCYLNYMPFGTDNQAVHIYSFTSTTDPTLCFYHVLIDISTMLCNSLFCRINFGVINKLFKRAEFDLELVFVQIWFDLNLSLLVVSENFTFMVGLVKPYILMQVNKARVK